MAELGLLGVFAHPDDEQLMSGLLAKAAAEGIRTGLVCATRGELGEISDPALATPENLGEVREHEMRAACAVLGVKYLWFLDYKDSGMRGTPGNDDPASLWQAREDEAVGRIVKVIREFKPQVLVTFDPTGGYGHPDHIKITQLAVAAFHAAGDSALYPGAGEPWQPSRIFYSGFPRSYTMQFASLAAQLDLSNIFQDLDPSQLGMDDSEITNRVDVSAWTKHKAKSLHQHRTQENPDNIFSKLPPETLHMLRAIEHYALAAGEPVHAAPGAEGDLFAGLR